MNSDELARRILNRLAPQNVELPALAIAGRPYGINTLRAMSDSERAQWGQNVGKVISQFIEAVDSGRHNITLYPDEKPETDVMPMPYDDWWILSIVDGNVYGNGQLLARIGMDFKDI